MTTESEARPGSGADLSRRMDRLEANHETLTREVSSLTSTVSRVEINQAHAEELNKLRFGALDTSVANLGNDLRGFMARIEGMLDGTVQTTASRQGAELVADYQRWRAATDDRLDEQDVRNGKVDLVAKVVYGLLAGNIVAIIGFIAWLASGRPG